MCVCVFVCVCVCVCVWCCMLFLNAGLRDSVYDTCFRYTALGVSGPPLDISEVPLRVVPLIDRQEVCTTSIDNNVIFWYVHSCIYRPFCDGRVCNYIFGHKLTCMTSCMHLVEWQKCTLCEAN